MSNNASIASAAPLNPNVPMQVNGDMDRGVNELQSNYRIGWIGANQWFNYTRNFPAGNYNVYAGISNGGAAGTGEYSRYGVLQMVTASSTNNLGIFGVGNGYATGAWGNNGGVGQAGGMGLVPLTDPNGNMLSIASRAPRRCAIGCRRRPPIPSPSRECRPPSKTAAATTTSSCSLRRRQWLRSRR